ncbi:hypothetical protein D0O09_29310, partial [Pseudomonas putida]
RSHRDRTAFMACAVPVGAGKPAKRPVQASKKKPAHAGQRGPRERARPAMFQAMGIQANAGTTSLMNSSSDFFFSAWGRLLSHQKLNSSTPSSW